MGSCTSRNNKESNAWEKNPSMLIHKVKLLQQEINAILQSREEDNEAYERELMLFAFKEAEWKKERKKLRDEAKRLRKSLEEKEEKIRLMENEVDQIVENNNKSSIEHSSCVNGIGIGGSSSSGGVTLSLMEQMKEERVRRDETVEKWKMLYLAIKNELDELIHKTHQGTLYWRADEEDLMEDMQRELKAKDEIIQVLKAQIISMENDEYKCKREVDILRQSFKILSNRKGVTSVTNVKSRSKRSIRLKRSLSKLAIVN